MQLFKHFGAALWMALLSVSALVTHKLKQLNRWTPPGLIPGEAGVVVVTYCWPNGPQGGTLTPPTGAQARLVPVQTAQIFFADTDTQAVFIHNAGLPASFPSQLYPIIVIDKVLGGPVDTSFRSAFTFGKALTNSVTINKISAAAGSGGTYDVTLFMGFGPWQK